MVPYINGIPKDDPKNTIYLFADAYRTHHSNAIQATAAMLNIKIKKIPKGTTDECQPLDCRIFGALKAKAKGYFNKKVSDYVLKYQNKILSTEEGQQPNIPPFPKTTRQESSSLFDRLWKSITPYHVLSARNMAFEVGPVEEERPFCTTFTGATPAELMRDESSEEEQEFEENQENKNASNNNVDLEWIND